MVGPPSGVKTPEVRMAVKQDSTELASNIGCLGVLARLAWLGLGNGLLVLLAAVITQPGADRVTDLLFWLVAVLILVARYVDVRWLGGLTAEGEPASMADWRRHVAIMIPVAAALWAGAHFIASVIN